MISAREAISGQMLEPGEHWDPELLSGELLHPPLMGWAHTRISSSISKDLKRFSKELSAEQPKELTGQRLSETSPEGCSPWAAASLMKTMALLYQGSKEEDSSSVSWLMTAQAQRWEQAGPARLNHQHWVTERKHNSTRSYFLARALLSSGV